MAKLSKKTIKKKLSEVLDPELNISIVDLGLIYDITVDKKSKVYPERAKRVERVKIIMTLTTMGCPLISIIEQEIKNKLKDLNIDEENIIVELTFDPPWSMEKMTPKAKAMLGI